MCCCQYFKDTNWKQITTKWKPSIHMPKLLPIFQRYKLKANHNFTDIIIINNIVVANISKIQIESKSQPTPASFDLCFRCCQYFKDTNWKQITTREVGAIVYLWLLPIFQRYKLKANHNFKSCIIFVSQLLPIFQRYKLKANHNYLSLI